MAPKTFCALPFHQMTVMNDGKVRLCCRSEVNMTSEGRDLSLHHATLGQIWNSDYLRSVRRRMLSGLGVQDCLQCYATEAGWRDQFTPGYERPFRLATGRHGRRRAFEKDRGLSG